MQLHVLLCALSLLSNAVAIKFPIKQARRNDLQPRDTKSHFNVLSPTKNDANANNELSLSTVHDLIYLTNVSIGGSAYPVQLDTGSSDLWVKGPQSPLPNTNQTSTTYNLTYGIGWAFGHVSYAQVDFAGITVPQQALLDVSSVDNPALGYGADGILGLGFTSLSTIDALINATGASTGRSLLYNLFQADPSAPNFISFSLESANDPGDTIQGVFSVGEYEDAYSSIANNPQIPTWPVQNPKRWNVLVDSVIINGGQTVIPSTSVSGAPSNKAVALLDSGTSYSYAPTEITDALYSGIQGASFNSDLGQWIVPCDVEIDMALQIGGQVFPMNPLDLTPNSLTDPSSCVGSFVPGGVAVGAGEFDMLIGDNFLRSVYSVYDFGDFDANHNMGNPYIRLMALVDPDKASSEFATARGTTAKSGITYNASNDTSSGSPAQASTVTVSGDLNDTLNKITTYIPIMLAVMGLNVLVVLILIVAGLVYLLRRKRSKKSRAHLRTAQGRLTPAPIDPRNSYIAGSVRAASDSGGAYAPISMAITEDTVLVPPSPGFKKFEGSAGDRPRSMGVLSGSGLYQEMGSEDALFSPGSPGFGRPSSVASFPSARRPSHPESVTLNMRGPEDMPFIPPAITLRDSSEDDKISLRSMRSAKSQLAGQASPSGKRSPFEGGSPASGKRSPFEDKAAVNDDVLANASQPPTESASLLPNEGQSADVGSTSLVGMESLQPVPIANFELSERPRSILRQSSLPQDIPDSIQDQSPIGPSTAPSRPIPAAPDSPVPQPQSILMNPMHPAMASQESIGSQNPYGPRTPTTSFSAPIQTTQFAQPQPPFHRPGGVALHDRPMSAVLPGQYQPPSPSMRPARSALRPNPSTAARPMSANVGPSSIAQTQQMSFGQMQQMQMSQDVGEEDITTFKPPQPFFHRSPLSKGSRPSSMA